MYRMLKLVLLKMAFIIKRAFLCVLCSTLSDNAVVFMH